MRRRFEPPIPTSETELRGRPFLSLLTRAGTADAYDREADARDYQYWIDEEGPGLLDRGSEIDYKRMGALAGLWYFWDRRIGWQATGADAARYGPFAVDGNHPTPNGGPPTGWVTPFVDRDVVITVPVVDPPAPPPATTPGVLDRIDLALGELRLNDTLVRHALAELIALQLAGTSGSVLGYTLNLTSRTDRRAALAQLVLALRHDEPQGT